MKKLTCHCGGVEIEVSLPNGLKNLVRCNCSICK
ncbi:MAG TPA: GFA family protein, partial [Candidatus Pelagibacter sp.]|nr:GFA family protein [Candidatus Pelagibacter sp.]